MKLIEHRVGAEHPAKKIGNKNSNKTQVQSFCKQFNISRYFFSK
jgi:hypothetical protein